VIYRNAEKDLFALSRYIKKILLLQLPYRMTYRLRDFWTSNPPNAYNVSGDDRESFETTEADALSKTYCINKLRIRG
jgi:hypothetical protein